MKTQQIIFDDKNSWLQKKSEVVSSTEVSAILNVNKYMTLFELWHRKKNKQIQNISENERMMWGTLLESAIAQGIERKFDIKLKKMDEFIFSDEFKIGSSFDYRTDDSIVEIKNVDSLIYSKEWTEEEAPPHIELQVQFQMMLAGLNNAKIFCLVGGNELKMISRDSDKDIQELLFNSCKSFWHSIEKNIEPTPDFHKDADYIKEIYNKSIPGSVMNTDDLEPLARKYYEYSLTEKEAREAKEAIKAELLTKIGSYEKVKGNKFSISASVIKKEPYTVKAQEYRNFKLTYKE